ncbi:hypothetical protein BD626DRAFT_23942 [Schizophyllum amplum]|uniref:Uncharacterized protein n=1 Tax=Schizophyllum amplum TaxID=97359 RepID=A0A550CZA6_9AGAR|nr:hypothetical protein BD626DRAFT_23942 [Auriculariopsis ampla]
MSLSSPALSCCRPSPALSCRRLRRCRRPLPSSFLSLPASFLSLPTSFLSLPTSFLSLPTSSPASSFVVLGPLACRRPRPPRLSSSSAPSLVVAVAGPLACRRPWPPRLSSSPAPSPVVVASSLACRRPRPPRLSSSSAIRPFRPRDCWRSSLPPSLLLAIVSSALVDGPRTFSRLRCRPPRLCPENRVCSFGLFFLYLFLSIVLACIPTSLLVYSYHPILQSCIPLIRSCIPLIRSCIPFIDPVSLSSDPVSLSSDPVSLPSPFACILMTTLPMYIFYHTLPCIPTALLRNRNPLALAAAWSGTNTNRPLYAHQCILPQWSRISRCARKGGGTALGKASRSLL